MRHIVIVLVAAGFTALACYWRHRYDKRLISQQIKGRGGTIEQFRVRIRAIRSEYEVTYRDKDGKRRFGKCRTCGSGIYWAYNEEMEEPQQRSQRDAEDRAR